jgi:protein TonB
VQGIAAQDAKADVRTIFSSDDYPADAQRNGEEGTVQAELSIDARGRVRGCRVIRSSGHASLDSATCSILQRRARFKPAQDVNGDAVASSVVTPLVVWRLEG